MRNTINIFFKYLLNIIFCLYFAISALASDQNLTFDLPKKDPSEQCAEVNRVIKEFNATGIRKNFIQPNWQATKNWNHGDINSYILDYWKLHKLGNIYIKPIFSNIVDGSLGWIILDLHGKHLGIFSEATSFKGKIYLEEIKRENSISIWQAHIINNKNLQNYIEIEGCHIKSLYFTYL